MLRYSLIYFVLVRYLLVKNFGTQLADRFVILHALRSSDIGHPTFLFVLLSLFTTTVFAQTDTSYILPNIELHASRLNRFSIGQNKQVFSDTTIAYSANNSLSDLLLHNSGFTIKSYGLGSLSTPSARGTAAGHTAVLWNGFNLQNSMNGVVDFSLIPLSLINEAELQYGGGSALFGSGAIGGAVHLKNIPNNVNGFSAKLNAGFGSFSDFQQNAKINFHQKRITTDLSLFHHSAKNDFKYLNLQRTKYIKQSNSDFAQFGLSQNNYFQLDAKQKLSTHFWYQNTTRLIPPSLTEGQSDAQQEDESYRMSLEWAHLSNNKQTKIRAAYFKEYILFFSSVVDSSTARTQTYFFEAEQFFYLKNKHRINIGVHAAHFLADASVFEKDKTRNKLALFMAYKIPILQKQNLNFSIRQELIDKKFSPITASIATERALLSQWNWKAKLSKNYNVPTFNDLYWPGAGNKNLMPESGWSQELGLDFYPNKKQKNIKLGLTAFSNLVDNWILWAPNSLGIWLPENKRKVWARGVEFRLNTFWKWRNYNIKTTWNYDFTKSTIQEIYNSQNKESHSKQLIYVPLHKANANIDLSCKQFGLVYQQFFYGHRFTSTDNTKKLPAVFVGDLLLTYQFPFQKQKLKAHFQLKNIWNSRYELIAFRPMPGRHFVFSLMWQL
ncbi:MAG TPA: TonB-dependent receptor [Saprospiraceae bacterium]|nr:TonB-dependent receptor [Saprospiraceae bacterium]